MLLFCIVLPSLAFAQQSGADSAIASAKQQIVVSFNSAKAAEAAGANITSLTYVLNEAGDLLSRSELAYSQGDFAGAQSLASECSQRLGNVASESAALRDAAIQQESYYFWVNTVGSIVGTFVVIAVGFGVWRVLKGRHADVEVESEEQADEPS